MGTGPVEIGVREIYDLLMILDGKMDAYMRAQEPQMALFNHRLTAVENKMDKTADRSWLLYLTFIAAFVSLIGTFVPLVLK
jgi:hypothetical protein